MRRLAAGSAFATAIATLAVPTAPPAAAASRHCDGHRAYRKTHAVLVFRSATGLTDGVGNPLSIYYACARPDGRPVRVATDAPSTGGEYESNDQLLSLEVAGDFVASLVLRGAGDVQTCEKYQQSGCGSPWVKLTVANVRGGRSVAVDTRVGARGMLVSARGGVVWLVRSGSGSARLMAGVVGPKGRGWAVGVAQLDTGQLADVRLRGLTVSWRDQAGPRTVVLR